jgi:exopolysaccharide biosynthesis polyprenyl glycosylphosphotransferase
MYKQNEVAGFPVGRVSRGPGFRARVVLDGVGFAWLRGAVDFGLCVLAGLSALPLAAGAGGATDHGWVLVLLPPVAVVVLFARGMYRPRLRAMIVDGVVPVVGAISIATMLVLAGFVALFPDSPPGAMLVWTWLLAVGYVSAGRIGTAFAQNLARRHQLVSRPTLIVGAGVVGTHVARRIEESRQYGLKPVGFLDADPAPSIDMGGRQLPVLGGPADLERVALEVGAEHVIIAFTNASDSQLIPLVRSCEKLGLEISLVPRLFESVNDRIALEHLGGLPLLVLRAVDPKGWQFTVKHTLDRLLGALMLVVLAPVLLLTALAVKLSSPGPVLYRQRRVGRDGQVFDMLKFRSMREPQGKLDFQPDPGRAPGGIEGEDRRTAVGRFLRRTALDELPQLLNVLHGDMSLIGPRPERPEFVDAFGVDVYRYIDRQRVKSGITGWAQVNGFRGQTSLADRVEWDNYYVDNWSLWLDAKILVLTIAAVLRGGDENNTRHRNTRPLPPTFHPIGDNRAHTNSNGNAANGNGNGKASGNANGNGNGNGHHHVPPPTPPAKAAPAPAED